MILNPALPTPNRSIAGTQAVSARESGEKENGAANKHISQSPSSGDTPAHKRDKSSAQKNQNSSRTSLTESDLKIIAQLKERDMEVRRHEQAHLSAAGSLARSQASFKFQTGPDGRRYAIGGEVSIDTGRESDPAKTIQKMRTVQKAATAPANPSAKDMAIASKARQGENKARTELAELRIEELNMTKTTRDPSPRDGKIAAESYSIVMKTTEQPESIIDIIA